MADASTNPVPPALTAPRAQAALAPAIPVLERLREAGAEAWVVGGSVRDLLLGRPAKDLDVATSASPEVVQSLEAKTVPTGLRHGTVTVLLPGSAVEVTTFRTEGPYSDGRRPDWVRPGTLAEDLARRDFTVNAMAFDPLTPQFQDPHHGLADLAARRLRTVGDADARFREDGLRPLRGIRIAAVLEFTIEAEVLAAMERSRDVVARVARERVRDELIRLLGAPRPSVGFELLRRTGLLEEILPELLEGVGMEQNRWHAYDVYEHTLRSVDAAPADRLRVRLAALLHDVGKPRTRVVVDGEGTFHRHERVGRELAEEILRRLRFPTAEARRVGHLVGEHMFHYAPEWTDAGVRRFLRRVGPDHLEELFALRRADDLAHGTGLDSGAALRELQDRIDGIRARAEALGVSDLAVDGNDIQEALGLEPGPEVGRVLRRLLEQVLEDPARNTRETLLELARQPASRLDDPRPAP